MLGAPAFFVPFRGNNLGTGAALLDSFRVILTPENYHIKIGKTPVKTAFQHIYQGIQKVRLLGLEPRTE